MESDEHAALFTPAALEAGAPGLGALRRILQQATDTEPVFPVGLQMRGRSPTGTVHLLTHQWLPACGVGLNGWNPHRLTATQEPVSCQRCGRSLPLPRPPTAGQLPLFKLDAEDGGPVPPIPLPREP